MQEVTVMAKTIERLFYLALSDYPHNWLDKNFQKELKRLKKLSCIDNIYEIFFPLKYQILQKNNIKVLDFLENEKYENFPLIEGKKYSQEELTRQINKYFAVLKAKFEEGDALTRELLDKLKIIENGELPFDQFRQSNVFKALLFVRPPEEIRKGSSILAMLLIIWGIKKGDIFGSGVDKLLEIAEVYSCFAKDTVKINLNEAFEMLNKIFETNYKFEFNCEKYEV